MHHAIDGPQTKFGQQPSEQWLWNVLVQVSMGGKLSDLATLELLDRVIRDVELATYSLSAFFALPELGAYQSSPLQSESPRSTLRCHCSNAMPGPTLANPPLQPRTLPSP